MISKEKQIEEMARNITLFTERVIINRYGDAVGTKRSLFSEGEIAERFYNAGYRKQSEVAEEIFGEIEFDIAQLDFDREETRAIAIEGIIANAKKKYTQN